MAKTIRGKVSLDHLRGLLTEHCRKLPGYTQVRSDEFEVDFGPDAIHIKLLKPYVGECPWCEGSGKRGKGECTICDGTGKRQEHHVAQARISEYGGKHADQLRIEVWTEGKKMEVWKPVVDKIRKFIEELVGEPCVVVPMSKKEQIESQPPLEEQLQDTIEAGKHNAERYEAVRRGK